jgi:hypothetical protein
MSALTTHCHFAKSTFTDLQRLIDEAPDEEAPVSPIKNFRDESAGEWPEISRKTSDEKAPGKGQLTTGNHKSDSKKMTDTKTLVNSVMASIPLSGEIPDHHPIGDTSTTLPEIASKSNSPKQIELDQRFDKMIADAPEGDSTANVSSTSGNCAMASEASEVSVSSTFSESSDISESSKVLNFCSSVSSVSSVSSMTSMTSMPSIYTWENMALAAQAEEEAKQNLPTQIRSWFDKWIDPVFEANAEAWQIQISDMIGKHLMHATGEKHTLALVTAFHDLNASKFTSIPREGFIARAKEIMVKELASWIEA